jgi:hypothetical protein
MDTADGDDGGGERDGDVNILKRRIQTYMAGSFKKMHIKLNKYHISLLTEIMISKLNSY